MTTSSTKLPNQIRALRLERGLTLSELASLCETTPTQIARLEKGTRNLTPDWEQKIAAALKVDKRNLIFSSGLESFETSKLLDESFDEWKRIGEDKLLDREFLTTCFEISLLFENEKSFKKTLTPRNVFLIAQMMHDMFLPLYRRYGKTAELLQAMRQSVLLYIKSTVDKYGKKSWIGGIRIDDSGMFKEAIEPILDPAELANDEDEN